MRHSPGDRTVAVLAALSLALSAAPASVAATSVEGHVTACSISDASPASDAGGLEVAPAAAGASAETDGCDLPCEPGPCPAPHTTCAGAGACVTIVPLPAGASPAASSGPLGVASRSTERVFSSLASGVLTPPPRG